MGTGESSYVSGQMVCYIKPSGRSSLKIIRKSYGTLKKKSFQVTNLSITIPTNHINKSLPAEPAGKSNFFRRRKSKNSFPQRKTFSLEVCEEIIQKMDGAIITSPIGHDWLLVDE